MKSELLGKDIDKILRVPFYYLTDRMLTETAYTAWNYAERIYTMYTGLHFSKPVRPNYIDRYWYHHKYLLWVYRKAQAEIAKRNRYHNLVKKGIPDEWLKTLSKPVTDFVPPTDKELAIDVMLLFERFQNCVHLDTGKLVPISYINLAKRFWKDWNPHQRTLCRIDFDSIIEPRHELGWYD